MSFVGNNIRALRTLYGKGRDITQAELAKIVGVSRETVNKWEAGSIDNVRTGNIKRLCEHFGLTEDDLRSETNGLAARLRMQHQADCFDDVCVDYAMPNRVPLVDFSELLGKFDSLRPGSAIEVPSLVMAASHRLLAFTVVDDSMALVLPKGSHVIIDLDAVPKTGSIVVAAAPSVSYVPLVRRLHCGSTKAMLSCEGLYPSDDVVLSLADIRIIGTVVWFQSAKMLACN